MAKIKSTAGNAKGVKKNVKSDVAKKNAAQAVEAAVAAEETVSNERLAELNEVAAKPVTGEQVAAADAVQFADLAAGAATDAAAPEAGSSSGGGLGTAGLLLGGVALAGGVAVAAGGGGSKSDPVPGYTVASDRASVNEGGTVRFTISTQNVAAGTTIAYQITGITNADLASGSLTGTVTLDANGRAFVDIGLANDVLAEGAETLVFTLSNGTSSATVTVNDTSIPSANFVLTSTTDLVAGNATDDVIFGSSDPATFNVNDQIDGAGGVDTLKLELSAENSAIQSANVRNVEIVEVTTSGDVGDDVTLRMSQFDNKVATINVVDSVADLSIIDQQSIAAVNIVDTVGDVALDYDNQLVAGENDSLNISVDEFVSASLTVDAGIETLNINVRDGLDEESNFVLNADGAASTTVTGGRVGQSVTMTAAVQGGAAFSSTAFLGDMVLTSTDLKTASFGAGDDVVHLTGWADNTDASYNLGEGDNDLTITTMLNGSVVAGSGDDVVTLASTGSDADINVGAGDNDVTVEEIHEGALTAGGGHDVVTVGSTGAVSSINVGAGDNEVIVEGVHAGAITAGGGNDFVNAGSTALDSTINAGDGNNAVIVGLISDGDAEGTELVLGASHEGSIVTGTGNDDILVGATGSDSSIDAGNGANRVVVGAVVLDSETGEILDFEGSEHHGSIVTGSGDDQVWTGSVHGGSINVGDGTNTVEVHGDMSDGAITVGDGDGNEIFIDGDVYASEPGTISIGDGDNNTLEITGNLTGDAVVFGAGTGNSFTIGDDVQSDASITLGNGDNTGWIMDNVENGGTVTFGTGDDTLTIGTGGSDNAPSIYASDSASEISMGGGDDHVTILNANEDYEGGDDGIVYSGGFINGNGGNDTLTLKSEVDVDLIQRDLQQVNTLDLSEETFAIGDVIRVTFTRGTEVITVTHTVNEVVQGPENLAATVAAALATKLGDVDGFGATASSGVITITSDVPHEDFVITSTRGDVAVVQISDARITSFETLELVALDSAGEDNIEITADFDLIDGTDTIKLDSQVARNEITSDGDVYDGYEFGGVTEFNLENLKGGEAIHVSGHEATASGNSQVNTITVGDVDNDHVVGDKIVVTIGATVVTYTITAQDLAADTAELDANAIATSLAAAISGAATSAGMTVSRADNVLTLISRPGEQVDISVDHVRSATRDVITEVLETTSWNVEAALGIVDQTAYDPIRAGDLITITLDGVTKTYTVTAEDCDRLNADAIVAYFAANLPGATSDWGTLNFDGDADVTVTRVVDIVTADKTVLATVQSATDTDDDIADVVIDAFLAEGAEDTTMDLTVKGHGDFDIAITGGEDSAYTDLNLKLGDTHDHTIDTGGNGIIYMPAFFRAMGNIEFDITHYDLVMRDGTIVRGVVSDGNDPDEVSISTDGGETFTDFNGDLYGWAQTEFGDEYQFYLAMETITAYSGAPGDDGVQSVVYDSGFDAFGSFDNSITVSDVAGVNTTGADIVLENVLAHTVTSTSRADLTIDQYSVRSNTYGEDFEDGFAFEESITITTGRGDDHLITLAQSAMNDESSINLGTGSNTLSLGWGEDSTLDSADLEAIEGINYTGNLTQLDILNDVVLSQESTTLAMPGGVDNVQKVTFTDVEHGAGPLRLSDVERLGIDAEDVILGVVLTPPNYEWAEVNWANYDENTVYPRNLADIAYDLSNLLIEKNGKYFVVAPDGGYEVDGVLADFLNQTYDFTSNDIDAALANLGTATNDLTIDGAANNFAIESGEDFDLGLDGDVVGKLTVTKANGSQITGDLSVSAEDNVRFNVGNAVLAGLTVTADDGRAEVFVAGNDDASFDLGDVVINSASYDADEDGLNIVNNTDTSVTVDSLVMDGNEDIDLTIEDNIGLTADIGDVTITTNDDADVFIERNSDSDITLGHVSITSTTSDDETSDLYIYSNEQTVVTVAGLDIVSAYSAELEISSNTESDITITGDINLTADEDYADLEITNNGLTNVSLAADGTITMTSCDSSADVLISYNSNNFDPFENGPDQGALASRDFDITLGDLVLNADNRTELVIVNNVDDTYFGDLAVTVGDVDMFAHDVAQLQIGDSDGEENVATTVVVGNVNMLSQNEAYVDISYNEGRLYEVQMSGQAVRREIDYADITLGDVTIESTDQNVWFDIDNSSQAKVNVGAVDIDAGTRANMWIGNNDGSSDDILSEVTINVDSVTMNAVSDADFAIDGNDARSYTNNSDGSATLTIDVGAVDVTAGSDADFVVIYNDAVADNLGDASVSISVASVDLDAVSDTRFVIYDNDVISSSDGTASFDLTIGDVTMNAGNSAYVYVGYNDVYEDNGALSDGSGELSIAIGSVTVDASDDAYVSIYDNNATNDGSILTIDVSDVDIDTGDYASFNVSYTDADGYQSSSSVSIGNVSLTTATGLAEVDLYDNDAGGAQSELKVVFGNIELNSGADADLSFEQNDAIGSDSVVDIDTGTVDLTAEVDARFYVANNTADDWDSALTIDMSDVTIDAGEDADFDLTGLTANGSDSSVDVTLGDVMITAGDDADLRIYDNFANGEDSVANITVGDITVDAGNDVWFYVDGYGSTSTTLGNVDITSGLDQVTASDDDTVSSHVYFYFKEVEGTETISIDAQSTSDGEGTIFADIYDAYDLYSVTLSGTDAEMRIAGDVGKDEDDLFTIDLSGMTGSFSDGAANYDPEGYGQGQFNVDEGVYVYTVDANFDGAVIIRVGTSGLIYNAQSSSFQHVDSDGDFDFYSSDNTYDDWYGEEGWYSLGAGLDIMPVAQVQVLTFDTWNVEDNETVTIDVQIGAQTYALTVNTSVGGGDSTSGSFSGSGDLGSTGISYTVSGSYDDYFGSNFGEGTLTITLTGPADGTSFILSGVTDAQGNFGGDFLSNNITTVADRADDGRGNDSAEIFVFVGEDIGEVVIGGFNANAIRNINEGIDKLDFSEFAGITQLSDLNFYTDATDLDLGDDGYFNDVIITSDHFEGSIRLVGLADYDGWQAALNSSIVFGS